MPGTFLLGGARSGKSALAVRLASTWNGPVVFVATAEARDGEMAERIERHRRARPREWRTVEEPIALAAAIDACPADAFLVVDCISFWLANVLGAGWGEEEIEAAAEGAAGHAAARRSPTVLVSNEVGLGIVPATPLGRTYRDALGRVNTTFAAAADTTYFVAAGRVLELAPPPA